MNSPTSNRTEFTFIDPFAGIGGIRFAFGNAGAKSTRLTIAVMDYKATKEAEKTNIKTNIEKLFGFHHIA